MSNTPIVNRTSAPPLKVKRTSASQPKAKRIKLATRDPRRKGR